MPSSWASMKPPPGFWMEFQAAGSGRDNGCLIASLGASNLPEAYAVVMLKQVRGRTNHLSLGLLPEFSFHAGPLSITAVWPCKQWTIFRSGQ
jgi:hypothetical protein